jgi:SNF2 family DNA or RNA helicase
MGAGWTLTAACVTVFTELDWVPATLDQSEDRTHRIGQVNPVLIQYLVLKDSLDSMMIRKLVVKGRLIDKVMNT